MFLLWGGGVRFEARGVAAGRPVFVSVTADAKADTVMMTSGRMQLPASVLINAASMIRYTDYVNSD
jgi:hypothetical protein